MVNIDIPGLIPELRRFLPAFGPEFCFNTGGFGFCLFHPYLERFLFFSIPAWLCLPGFRDPLTPATVDATLAIFEELAPA